MKTSLFSVFAGLCLVALPAQAADCGEPPMDQPGVPDGSTSNADQIRDARDAIVNYSERVDAYLTCMDQRAATIMPYLTKEQKVRWDEDLADIHEQRRQLQVKMNEAIRAYRRSRSG